MFDGEAQLRPWMKDASLGEPVIGDLRYAIPGQTGPLTAPPKRPPPEIGQIEPKRIERSAIRRDSKVRKVAGQDLPQPFPLCRDRPVHSAP